MPRAPQPAKEPVIAFTATSACVANCTKGVCPRGMQPILEFAPAVSNITHRNRAKFLKCVSVVEEILAATGGTMAEFPIAERELKKDLALLRSKTCKTCRLIAKKTKENPATKYGACRAK